MTVPEARTLMIKPFDRGCIKDIVKAIQEANLGINPTDNDYLFFVADRHGNIFFTKTNAEHVAKVAEIKKKGDWIW